MAADAETTLRVFSATLSGGERPLTFRARSVARNQVEPPATAGSDEAAELDLGEDEGAVRSGLAEGGEEGAFAGGQERFATLVVGEIDAGVILSRGIGVGSFAGLEEFDEEAEEGDCGRQEDVGEEEGGGHVEKPITCKLARDPHSRYPTPSYLDPPSSEIGSYPSIPSRSISQILQTRESECDQGAFQVRQCSPVDRVCRES